MQSLFRTVQWCCDEEQPQLTDDQIRNIVKYLDQDPVVVVKNVALVLGIKGEEESSSAWMTYVVVLVLVLLATGFGKAFTMVS